MFYFTLKYLKEYSFLRSKPLYRYGVVMQVPSGYSHPLFGSNSISEITHCPSISSSKVKQSQNIEEYHAPILDFDIALDEGMRQL